MPKQQAELANLLLSRLAPQDFALIADRLEPVELPLRSVLAERDHRAGALYFLDAGIGSVVARAPNGLEAEVGMFGRDGFAPTSLFLGADLPGLEFGNPGRWLRASHRLRSFAPRQPREP